MCLWSTFDKWLWNEVLLGLLLFRVAFEDVWNLWKMTHLESLVFCWWIIQTSRGEVDNGLLLLLLTILGLARFQGPICRKALLTNCCVFLLVLQDQANIQLSIAFNTNVLIVYCVSPWCKSCTYYITFGLECAEILFRQVAICMFCQRTKVARQPTLEWYPSPVPGEPFEVWIGWVTIQKDIYGNYSVIRVTDKFSKWVICTPCAKTMNTED
jgi:hypothetical protein